MRNKTPIVLALGLLFACQPVSALPESVTWLEGVAVASGGVLPSAVDVDNDGEKIGLLWRNSSAGCRFLYGDATDGWISTIINSTATGCHVVRYVSNDTWIAVFSNPSTVYYIARSTDNGANWTTYSTMVIASGSVVERYRFFIHSPTFFSSVPANGLDSRIYITTDGGLTWSTVTNGVGNCPMSDGNDPSVDIEYPFFFTGSTLKYITTNVTRKVVSMTSAGICDQELAFTTTVPTTATNSAVITAYGWVIFRSTSGSCDSDPTDSDTVTVPPSTYLISATCSIVYTDSASSALGFSEKGVALTLHSAGAGNSRNVIFYDGSGVLVSNVTSFVGTSESCTSITMFTNGTVYCFYRDDVDSSKISFITTQVSVATVDEPPDFGTGLAAFMAGIGFITPESQFLFAIILVGLTTVTLAILLKFMGSGRTKMITVATTAMLVGIFCVVLSMIDLWMYTLGLVLAVFIVRGSGDLKNTVFEIQKFVKERVGKSSGEGEADEVAGYVEASASPISKITEEEEVEEEPSETDSPEPSSEPEE